MRVYVSRGRTGVSFGIIGSIIMGFAYLVVACYVVMALAAVALVSSLNRAYRRHKGLGLSTLPPPPIEQDESVAFFDSTGQLITGRFVNKRLDGSGRVTFDWRPDDH